MPCVLSPSRDNATTPRKKRIFRRALFQTQARADNMPVRLSFYPPDWGRLCGYYASCRPARGVVHAPQVPSALCQPSLRRVHLTEASLRGSRPPFTKPPMSSRSPWTAPPVLRRRPRRSLPLRHSYPPIGMRIQTCRLMHSPSFHRRILVSTSI